MDSEITNKNYTIEFANKYSNRVWHELMNRLGNNPDYKIGFNDVSDFVYNAILDYSSDKMYEVTTKCTVDDIKKYIYNRLHIIELGVSSSDIDFNKVEYSTHFVSSDIDKIIKEFNNILNTARKLDSNFEYIVDPEFEVLKYYNNGKFYYYKLISKLYHESINK